MNIGNEFMASNRHDHFDQDLLGQILAHGSGISLAVLSGGRIVFANPAFHALFRPVQSLIGVKLTEVVVDSDTDRPGLADAIREGRSASTRYYGVGRQGDGELFDVELCLSAAPVRDETVTIVFAWDITRQQRFQEQLAYLAYTDPLTGLDNRARFTDRLHQAVRQAQRDDAVLAVLMVDLDGFKAVNDTHGHDVGDAVLQYVGQRMQGCVRRGDTVARIGGDEFAVLLPGMTDQQPAVVVAQRMINAIRTPLDVAGHTMAVGASIGIAAWPEHAGTGSALVTAADTAMYRAKRAGTNQIRWATGALGVDPTALQSLRWTVATTHAVGVREMDEQHAHVAELIDRLSAALVDDEHGTAAADDLEALIRYTAYHFASEENLMMEHQVDDPAHRDEHQRLLRDLRNLQVDGDVASISLLLRYLQEWLLRHLDRMDKRLALALLAKGCH